MTSQNQSLDLVRQKFVKNHLELTALIQDIQQCSGPLELLNDLNAEGREKIASLRSNIEELTTIANEEINTKKKSELMAEVEGLKSQLTSALAAFRTANVVSSCVITKLARENLFSMSEEEQKYLRRRKDKQYLTEQSGQVTNKLLSISRHLAETVDRSANTLDTLVTSSDKVSSTRKELENQQQVILQSGKLLGKYGRREITDKALLALAFIFFLACVFYILQKRLF